MICDMKKYVILDIDRTIINGTSWYHACSCPNLLIDEYNIDRFKELNNKMYVHGTSKDRYEFRKQTFELINKRVSESAYRKLSECGCADEILIGQNVNEVFFEAVGIYTYKKLMKSDEDCKKIVDFIYKYYFGDIEFIFLTSGYEPFMKGLVKEYMKSFHKNCTWRTIGSTIKFSNGCIYLKEVMTQEKKFQFVKKIIDYGNRVVFLADDSVEEKELFSVVFRNGGYAFNVRYDEKLHESNWHELINDIEDENVFLSYLMKNSEVALSDCKKVQNNFFRLHMNEIGVICLNDIEYQIFLGSFNRDKKIVEYIKKVSHKKEEKYYLRGRYYYYWLPSYITGSLESKYAGWKKIVIDGIDIIEHIARYNIKENKYACILSYVICDHLLSVLYLAMYCAEEDVLDRERNVISSYRHIENSVCILNKILFSVFDNKIEYSNLDSLVKELKSISFEDMDIIRENEKFLLELDNYNTIYEAVYNIIDNLKVKAQKIDKVIYFAYGGISLGYAFKTIMKELFDKNVELLPSHYSSKRNNTESGIIDRIPRFKCGENGWMDESTVLLLDNNVTTFKTLSTSKSYLQKRGNKVYCAVAEVDYKNIYKWLLGKGEYEEMCHNWFDVIDAKPIMNYFSAYNTWGTSETSALLEQLYSQDFIFQNTDNLIPRKIHSEHRKICRIHNVYDLRLAMEMGATMIGIHAVISCKDKYYKIFNDYDVRELVIKHLNLVEGKFKRFGASGSRPSEKHPGGEVVELQTIDVKNKTGCAGSVSGYLDMSNNEYSKAISLSEDELTLREERTVYSHTIWIPENSKPIIVRVQSNIKGLSLLSVILEECKKMKIHACGISVAIDGMKTLGIKGRVLKNIPIQPFKELQEATDIAVEKEFLMPKCSTFLMYGTLYNRFEPEWREFTKGRQYEKRGHYHAKINGDYLENVHEVFHVRDVFLNKEQCVEISIYPASKTYRIIPITKKGNEYITCSFEKNINKYVENYCNYDYYL